MIDDDLYYILLDEVQLVPRFEALPKISENTQIFLVEILENTQIFLVEILENTQILLAEILENTQIFYNIVVVLPTFYRENGLLANQKNFPRYKFNSKIIHFLKWSHVWK